MAAKGCALRGFQQIPCALLRLLDRPRYAFEAAPSPRNLLEARAAPELFSGSLGIVPFTEQVEAYSVLIEPLNEFTIYLPPQVIG